MAYSSVLRDALQSFFDSSGITVSFSEKGGYGIFSFRVKVRSKLQNVQTIVIVREDNYSALITLPLAADEDHRLAVAEYLTRANFNLRIGNFELNMESGEIRYKTYVASMDAPDPVIIRNSIFLPLAMIDRFGDGLLEVLFGFRSPKEAFDAIANTPAT